jgi:small GTP-binding protein
MSNNLEDIRKKSFNKKRTSGEAVNVYEKKILRFKTILIGDASVGKTSILQRFIHNRFKIEYNCTIGVDYWVKSLQIDNKYNVDMQIWDTCGQERFKTITRQYYRDTHGCILVFDLSRKESFNNIEIWIEDIKNFGNQEMSIIIVGNKADLVDLREVTKEEIDEFTKKYDYTYIEVSAFTGDNIKQCFEILGKKMALDWEAAENMSIMKKRFKVDNGHVTVNKSVELDNSYKNTKKNSNCC